jgi:hypothetical protein
MNRIVILLLLNIFILDVCSQDKQVELDITTMTIENAKRVIDEARLGDGSTKVVNEVLRSRRMELITLCFISSSGTADKLLEMVSNLSDVEFMEHILVMTLKTNSQYYWPSENILSRSGVDPRMGWMREPYISLIKKYVPDIALSDEMLKTFAARYKLGLEIENAMLKMSQKPTLYKTSNIPGDNIINRDSAPKNLDDHLVSKTSSNATNLVSDNGLPAPNISRVWFWLLCAGIATLILIVALFIKIISKGKNKR